MTKAINYCPRCMNDNKHTVLFNTTRHDMYFPKDTVNYSVNECDGCGYVTMLYEELDDIGQIELATYPDDHLYNLGRYHQEFLKDQQIKTLPKMIAELYLEVQTAINNECLVLSGIGLRTLLKRSVWTARFPVGIWRK